MLKSSPFEDCLVIPVFHQGTVPGALVLHWLHNAGTTWHGQRGQKRAGREADPTNQDTCCKGDPGLGFHLTQPGRPIAELTPASPSPIRENSPKVCLLSSLYTACFHTEHGHRGGLWPTLTFSRGAFHACFAMGMLSWSPLPCLLWRNTYSPIALCFPRHLSLPGPSEVAELRNITSQSWEFRRKKGDERGKMHFLIYFSFWLPHFEWGSRLPA